MLLLAAAALTARAAETTEGVLDGGFTWSLADSVLTIHGTGKMPSYNPTSIAKLPWQNDRFAAGVKKIVIEEGITEVGSYCFGSRTYVRNVRDDGRDHAYYNTQDAQTSELFFNIEDVILPSSLVKIGHHAFARMPLTHVALPEGLQEIAAGAFANTALRCVILPAGIRKVGPEAFCGCQNLRAVDFSNASLKLATGVLFDAESLRMLCHTGSIRSVEPSAFNSTALEGVAEEELLEMFHSDGVNFYLDTYVPPRENFAGSDEEYEQMRNKALDLYYQREAKNATSLFKLDRFTLSPYDAESGTVRVQTVHNGTHILPLTAQQAEALALGWKSVNETVTPVFLPVNGHVELQSVRYRMDGDEVAAAIMR